MLDTVFCATIKGLLKLHCIILNVKESKFKATREITAWKLFTWNIKCKDLILLFYYVQDMESIKTYSVKRLMNGEFCPVGLYIVLIFLSVESSVWTKGSLSYAVHYNFRISCGRIHRSGKKTPAFPAPNKHNMKMTQGNARITPFMKI